MPWPHVLGALVHVPIGWEADEVVRVSGPTSVLIKGGVVRVVRHCSFWFVVWVGVLIASQTRASWYVPFKGSTQPQGGALRSAWSSLALLDWKGRWR